MEVADFFGPMYWGFVVSVFLVGGTLIQGYKYYSHTRDTVRLQVAVALMLLLDVASTAVMGVTVFHFFIVNFGHYPTFLTIPLEWTLEAILTGAVTCGAQLFFASRIRKIMRGYAVFGRWEDIIPIIITCTALLALVASVVKTVFVATGVPTDLGDTSMVVATSFEEGFAAISDLFATCTLCLILASSRGNMRRMRPPIRRLFFFILNRGILVTIFQIATLVAFVVKPGYMYWVPFHLSKSKLYTNTLLAMLNSRSRPERLPSWTPHFGRDLPAQDVSSREVTSQAHSEALPDRSQVRAWENARVNWEGRPENPRK